MADLLCSLMGICDIIAGIIIIIAFMNTFSAIFGIIMIVKGAISFL
jgi:hypothetical protein